MERSAFIRLAPSCEVRCGEATYRITHEIDLDSVLGENIATGERKRLKVADIEAVQPDAGGPAEKQCRASDISDKAWSVAEQRWAIIKPLVDRGIIPRAEVEAVATRAGVDPSTIYRWLSDYSHSGHLSALAPTTAGRPPGRTSLSPEVEAIIAGKIEDAFLTRQKLKPSDIIEKVEAACRQAKLPVPGKNTVRARIAALHPQLVLRRRGERAKADNLGKPVRGHFPGADKPLAVVQIDHTQLDVIVVEETTRLPMGRPWLTLAIDVYSRMVTGYHLSMERPNANAVGLCLSMSMLPKGPVLEALGVPGEWPVYGRLAKVMADNAKEFRGKLLARACRDWGIDLDFRPVKTPHYGGHIERLMGTTANEVRKLDGATFSNTRQREGYNSEGMASMTLGEVERYLVDFLTTTYHMRLHSEIEMTPRRRWQVGLLGDGVQPGAGLPEKIADAEKLRLDFTPCLERTIQRYGVEMDKIGYQDEVLYRWAGATDPDDPKRPRQFEFRRDPRDVSRIWFWDPEIQRYFAIPYRDLSHPSVSLWQIKAAKAELKRQGVLDVDEDQLFKAIARREGYAEEARAKTKAARREFHRASQVKPAPAAAPVQEPRSTALSPREDDGLFDTPPVIYGDIEPAEFQR